MEKKKFFQTGFGKFLRLVLALLLCSSFFFVALLFTLLAAPVYVMQAAPFLYAALWLAVPLSLSGFLNRKWLKGVWLAVLCVAVGAAGWMARGYYIQSIPTVDDRSLLLWKYEPFSEGSLAVTLEEPSALRFDEASAQNLRLDGATALYPVYAAFVQAVYPEEGYPNYRADDPDKYGYGPVMCTGTNDAYERLCRGSTDIIFVAAPSQEQLDRAHMLGLELYLTPIGREAFVFFVNSKNPVTGLTVEEVQGIYTGEITNWKQVGGENRSILPYQRRENSGSQSALLRLMEGLPLLEPKEEQVVEGMGGIIRQVASYRNYRGAIGFTFRYYATEMVQNGDIRLLALNGVEPTKETIRDGSYPISESFYAVTAGPIGEAPPQQSNRDMAAFLEWIVSPQGQELVEKTGYVPLE